MSQKRICSACKKEIVTDEDYGAWLEAGVCSECYEIYTSGEYSIDFCEQILMEGTCRDSDGVLCKNYPCKFLKELKSGVKKEEYAYGCVRFLLR
jgi:hypothetical protein